MAPRIRIPRLHRTSATIDRFHELYYRTGHATWMNTRWLGVRVFKCPLDLWIYQELLFDLRPDVVVETGTFSGGSALFIAGCMDHIGQGRVLTVDIQAQPDLPVHPRVTYVSGSSTAPDVVDRIAAETSEAGVVMVILDSDHSRDHVLAELQAYAPLVTKGSYLVVEDTNVNGHPVRRDFGPGPMEAVDAFLAQRSDFVVDPEREKFYLTFNPRGFLRRVGADPRATG